MIKCVAFDFDGTIVQSNGIKRRVFYDTTAHLSGAADILDKIFSGSFKGDRYATFSELCQRLDRQPETTVAELAASLTAAYTQSCREKISSCNEVAGALNTLRKLASSGTHAYLISATPEPELVTVVSDRGLNVFFQGILGGPADKAEHLNTVLRREGIPRSALAMIGDGLDDSEAAEKVGCHFIAIKNSGNPSPAPTRKAVEDLIDLPLVLAAI